jgi:hypothetical protein
MLNRHLATERVLSTECGTLKTQATSVARRCETLAPLLHVSLRPSVSHPHRLAQQLVPSQHATCNLAPGKMSGAAAPDVLPVEGKTVKALTTLSLKRTFDLFAANYGQPIPVDEER